VGGSAIEASKIAGHSDLEMTGEYTFVTPERQNELTRRIQEKLASAGPRANRAGPSETTADTAEFSAILAAAKPATSILQ
jgi:hypothetical protein